MKFKYKRYGPEILRPVIPIEVVANNIEVPYEVLVDSGADICIFDSQIANILGIDVVKGIKKQVLGVTGFPEDMYLHTIHLNIGGHQYKMEVGFMEMRNSSYGVVGQKEFFELFVVKFDLKKNEVELKPH
jgi:hypothetical protein